MSDVSLAPINQSLREAAVRNGWFRSEKVNHTRGFGRGAQSVVAATEAFSDLLAQAESGDPSVSLVGIYEGSVPVGYFVSHYLGETRKAVQFDMMLEGFEETSKRDELARSALRDYLDILFSQTDREIFRAQAEVLTVRKRFISLLRKMETVLDAETGRDISRGFVQEGRFKQAYWIDGDAYDTVHLRMLRPAWTKIQRESSESVQ